MLRTGFRCLGRPMNIAVVCSLLWFLLEKRSDIRPLVGAALNNGIKLYAGYLVGNNPDVRITLPSSAMRRRFPELCEFSADSFSEEAAGDRA